MPINFQWLPFKSIIGPIDHANISAGVVNGAANAVSFSVLERFSGAGPDDGNIRQYHKSDVNHVGDM